MERRVDDRPLSFARLTRSPIWPVDSILLAENQQPIRIAATKSQTIKNMFHIPRFQPFVGLFVRYSSQTRTQQHLSFPTPFEQPPVSIVAKR